MPIPFVIERYEEIVSGEDFNIPDGWKFYSYKCKTGATVTVTNVLNESYTDNGSGSSINNFPGGCKSVNLAAIGGNVIVKWY